MISSQTTVLITGGTGSFGQAFVTHLLRETQVQRITIFSRDEYKHYKMQQRFANDRHRLRFIVGDIRDSERLIQASRGTDILVHAAALKHIPLMEENPGEAIKTNILGSQNVIGAAAVHKIPQVVALSTDKAASPANLYGATKHIADKLFIAANAYNAHTRLSVVRYGNIAGSRGSVIPFFQDMITQGKTELPITDIRMTRFWISLNEGIQLVIKAINEQKGGEIYVSKIPSFKIVDLAKVMLPQGTTVVVGKRPGEKLHETMINEVDSDNTYEYDRAFIIYPQLSWWNPLKYLHQGGKKVAEGFTYVSNDNTDWLNENKLVHRLQELIHEQHHLDIR